MAAAPGGGASPGGGAALEEECEVVRVRVKKNEGQQPPEFRSFAVDPQITSLDVLQHILARAFDLQGKKSFVLSFAAHNGQGQDTFVPLLSDGDLANAFSCARPALRLRLDVRNGPESPLLEDWDIISPREVAAAEPVPERRSLLAAALPFTQALLAQVGRTLARAQAALAWPEGTPATAPPPAPPPPCAPLGDADLRSYLGPGGRLLRPQDLRLHVFHGGVEPGLRKVVWRYLLNVFPAGLSGQERLSHLRLKAAEYSSLKAALAARAAPAELAQVAAAVRKDVVRTDRAHPYFGGPEEGHPHLAALQALLTTFALGHPRLSYCQGMSDVAAPLLAVLDDEAQAFVCFCSLMRRLAPRFRPGGRGLARAFAHLRRLLRRADPPFWAFLAARGAHDLLFCYRWLLLELKREFAFDDALKVLEITWSSLPPAPPPPPEGVPLLGAPLGARGAGRALRERRGLRPRPPRRRRRRRSVEEEERAGGLAEGSGGGFGGLKGSSDGPEGPKSSGDVPNSHKISSELFESPKSFSDVLEGSEGSQEDPKSSSDVPNRLGDSQKGPKIFKNVQEGLESSSDVPKGHKSSRKVQGRSPRDAGGAPEGSKDSEPGGPRKVEEGTDALEIDQRPHSLCWGAGEDPREGQDDRREGHDPGEGRGGPKEGPDDPREEPADPGMNRGDPREGDDDLGEGHNIGEGHNSPKDVRHDPRDGHRGFRDGRGDPKEGCDDPRRGRDDLKDDHRDLKPNHDDPEEGRDDTKHGHDDLEDDHRATDNPKSPEDPWGGRWAWEEPSSSSSSSSSCSSGSSSSDEEVTVEDDGAPLPPPEELGQGNPFLLFVCLAMLLEQREAVMARAGDYNEVAMHFDRLVRRHHLPRVLRRAKALFARYLEGWGATAPGGPQTGPPSGQGVPSGAPTG
ncbi:TBC1 domain family member 25 [Lonchura striata]